MNRKILHIVALGSVLLLAGSGCTTMSDNPTSSGTVSGAAMGALLGGVAGNNIDGLNTAEGAVAGALVGGLLGHQSGAQQQRINNQQAQLNNQQAQINAAQQAANTQTVNITNSNGSVTPVVLHREGNQWRGPRGELYNSLPTPEQLKPYYGL